MKRLTTEEAVALFQDVREREIVVGGKYRRRAETAYCFAGCDQCVPGTAMRCWQRRAEVQHVYRIRELHYTDYQHGLGRCYLVTLVRPDKWQFLAFTVGGAASRLPSDKWHTVTGLVWAAEIGVRVDDNVAGGSEPAREPAATS